MAPLTWKLLLATATLADGQHCSATDSCEDQTALLQSHLASHKSSLATAEQAHMLNFPKMATLADPTRRKLALAQFEQTAMELATSETGVTDEVAEICNVTTVLLEDTVMQAILNEHETDKAMLEAAHNAFNPIEDQRAQYEIDIENAILPVYGDGGLIEEHIECRNTEAQECIQCGVAQQSCETHTEECDNTNLNLENAYRDVITTVTEESRCEGTPPTIHPPTTTQYNTLVDMTDHLANKHVMEIYLHELSLWVNCTNPPNHCDGPHPPPECECDICMVDHPPPGCVCHNHTNTIHECDVIQNSLQAQACSARYEVSNILALYHAAFTAVEVRYNQVMTSVMLMEADRKVEWDTLERVICLLGTLVHTEDGATSSIENEARIQQCRDPDQIPAGGIGTDHLTIIYPPVPDIGTLPELPPSPCSTNFTNRYYTNITEPCGGIVEFQERFEHGLVDVCECNADAPDPEPHGFPYELGPFLLFDPFISFTGPNADFQANVAGLTWHAEFEGQPYSGEISPFKPVTLPGLNRAFELSGEGTDSVEEVAWAYPNAAASAAVIAAHGEESEDIAHRFFRTGGFVWLNTESQVVMLKEISPTASMVQDPALTLNFANPAEITEAQANAACPGGMRPVTETYLRNRGGEEYCWDKSGSITVSGPHGAFLYKVTTTQIFTEITTTRWLAFAVTTAAAHDAPIHYAATDQQNADPSSMEVQYLAKDEERWPGRAGTETDKALREGTNWRQLAGLD